MVRPFKLTPAEVDEVWGRWRSGQAVKVLAREMRVNPSTVRDLLHRTGGIRPAPKRRWELRLSLAEREEISRGLAAGLSLRMIAAGLGRAPSTVSREVLGNGGRPQVPGSGRGPGGVVAGVRGRRRPSSPRGRRWPRWWRPSWSWTGHRSRSRVGSSVEFPDDGQMQVSHESIYRSLFVQTRGSLRKELTTHLRTKRATRRPAGVRQPDGRGAAPEHPQHLRTPGRGRRPGGARALGGRPGLRQRDEPGGHPGRAVDPVRDAGRRCPTVTAPTLVADALAAKITTLPAALTRSLTWDQGHEMAAHARFTVEHRDRGLLLRPEEPVAARQQREHQRPAAPVPAPTTRLPRP